MKEKNLQDHWDLSNISLFALNDAETAVKIIVPDDVLYHSLEVVEKAEGTTDILSIVDDGGVVALSELTWDREICATYPANTLPEVDSSFGTPWVLESDDPGSVTATIFGSVLTYGVGAATNTLYRNATPITDPVGLTTQVDFRLRLLQDATSGSGDTGVRFGFSALGLTAALAFEANQVGVREVHLIDLQSNETLATLPLDYLDGEYHVFRLVKNVEEGSLDLLLDP
jgi:hypothetical protein